MSEPTDTSYIQAFRDSKSAIADVFHRVADLSARLDRTIGLNGLAELGESQTARKIMDVEANGLAAMATPDVHLARQLTAGREANIAGMDKDMAFLDQVAAKSATPLKKPGM